MTMSERRLSAYLQEIEDLEQRLKLVSLVERRNVIEEEDASKDKSKDAHVTLSYQIRNGWRSNNGPRISPLKKIRGRGERRPVSAVDKGESYNNKHPTFAASQSLLDLEKIIKANNKKDRSKKRNKQKYNTHEIIGVPDFVPIVEDIRPSTSPPRRRRRRPKPKKITVPKMSARLEKLSQPGSGSVNYEEFKKELESRKHIQTNKNVPTKISKNTMEWINRSSKLPSHRRTKKYESEFKNCIGFGGAGSRFVGGKFDQNSLDHSRHIIQ
jgi:hypothetical protein